LNFFRNVLIAHLWSLSNLIAMMSGFDRMEVRESDQNCLKLVHLAVGHVLRVGGGSAGNCGPRPPHNPIGATAGHSATGCPALACPHPAFCVGHPHCHAGIAWGHGGQRQHPQGVQAWTGLAGHVALGCPAPRGWGPGGRQGALACHWRWARGAHDSGPQAGTAAQGLCKGPCSSTCPVGSREPGDGGWPICWSQSLGGAPPSRGQLYIMDCFDLYGISGLMLICTNHAIISDSSLQINLSVLG